MGCWLVKDSCKDGRGVYLLAGQIVDLMMPEFAHLSAKFVELAAKGLLEAISPVSPKGHPPSQEMEAPLIPEDASISSSSEEPITPKKHGGKKK